VLDIGGWEFIALIVLAVVILGPERLPEYAAKLGRFVRQARAMAEGAKGQLREQMGPEFDDINWQQYDPRRIVREALLEPDRHDEDGDDAAAPPVLSHDPSRATPYDVDAT
jgi:sec-independent protein translocase protein TatB